MVSNPIIAPTSSHEERDGTNIPLNKCSHLPLHREDAAFLSLVELRRQYVVDIAVTVAHIRELVLLEDAR